MFFAVLAAIGGGRAVDGADGAEPAALPGFAVDQQSVTEQPAITGEQVVIAIDPGHGGIDPGAVADGVLEKHVVLAIALRLRDEIDAHPGLRATLTRTDDRFVSLSARLEHARQTGAEALISLHADALAQGQARGVSVYTLSPAAALQTSVHLVERANRRAIMPGADLTGQGDDIARLLVDLAQRHSKGASGQLAQAVLGALEGEVDLIASRPHRRAGFHVLTAPEIPAILVEVGFLSDPVDRARLVSADWQGLAAKGIAAGIAEWTRSQNPTVRAPESWQQRPECATQQETGHDCATK